MKQPAASATSANPLPLRGKGSITALSPHTAANEVIVCHFTDEKLRLKGLQLKTYVKPPHHSS